MTEFTRGPWFIDRGFADWGLQGEDSITTEDGRLIASVPFTQPYAIGASPIDRANYRRQKANASLIVQAPAMREVIEMFLNRMSRFGEWDDGCFYYNKISASELQEPIRLAEAVLAESS